MHSVKQLRELACHLKLRYFHPAIGVYWHLESCACVLRVLEYGKMESI